MSMTLQYESDTVVIYNTHELQILNYHEKKNFFLCGKKKFTTAEGALNTGGWGRACVCAETPEHPRPQSCAGAGRVPLAPAVHRNPAAASVSLLSLCLVGHTTSCFLARWKRPDQNSAPPRCGRASGGACPFSSVLTCVWSHACGLNVSRCGT